MTPHLTTEAFAAALDGTLDAEGMSHLVSCDTCERELSILRDGLGAAGAVPEPSPLFWDHFAARVRAQTADQPVGPAAARRFPGWWSWVAAGAVGAVAVAALVVWTPADQSAPSAGVAAAASAAAGGDGVERWDSVVEVAAGMSSDDVRQMAPMGSDDALLISDLSPAERAAFVRLLRAEMEQRQ